VEASPLVRIGIGQREWRPRLNCPTLRMAHFSPQVFDIGCAVHLSDKVEVRIYKPAKTIADMFEFALQRPAAQPRRKNLILAISRRREGRRLGGRPWPAAPQPYWPGLARKRCASADDGAVFRHHPDSCPAFRRATSETLALGSRPRCAPCQRAITVGAAMRSHRWRDERPCTNPHKPRFS
jgi:hypothetical protein